MSDTDLGRALLWETIQQRETYPIFRLTYLSKPVKPFTDEDFDDIETKSVDANNARDVTGLLMVHGDRILQMLEGREAAVRELYAKIEADPRHTILKMVSTVEDEERLLLTWSMVVRRMSGLSSDVLEVFVQRYDAMLSAEGESEITLDDLDLFKAISLLGALPL
ncbi:MAG: BLUF domain-containing protein [Luteolibacter sp.]